MDILFLLLHLHFTICVFYFYQKGVRKIEKEKMFSDNVFSTLNGINVPVIQQNSVRGIVFKNMFISQFIEKFKFAK